MNDHLFSYAWQGGHQCIAKTNVCPKKMFAFICREKKAWFCIWQGWGIFGFAFSLRISFNCPLMYESFWHITIHPCWKHLFIPYLCKGASIRFQNQYLMFSEKYLVLVFAGDPIWKWWKNWLWPAGGMWFISFEVGQIQKFFKWTGLFMQKLKVNAFLWYYW